MKSKIIKILFFGSTHSSFICTVLIPFFHFANLSHFQISLLLTARKAIRIISDVPFGVLFDRFSPRFVLLVSRIFKFCSVACYLNGGSFYVVLIAMFFDGLSYSSNHGKINVYMFNALRSKKILAFQSRGGFFRYQASTSRFLQYITLVLIYLLHYLVLFQLLF